MGFWGFGTAGRRGTSFSTKEHGDCGNTPRCIGLLLAAAERYGGIGLARCGQLDRQGPHFPVRRGGQRDGDRRDPISSSRGGGSCDPTNRDEL